MRERIISGLVIAIAVIVLGIVGSYPLYTALMLCGAIGYLELVSALSHMEKRSGSERRGSGGSFLLFSAYALPGFFLTLALYGGLMYIEWRYGVVNYPQMAAAADRWTLFLVSLDFLLTMGIYVFNFREGGSLPALGTFASFIYAPVLLSFISRTRILPHGIFLYLLIFVCSSVSDVCALFTGKKIGNRKLARILSPKKTIEGAIGGVVGSAVVSCLVAAVLRFMEPEADYMVLFAVIGVFGSIIAQIGDLSASAIKRDSKIKDYGKLIPGHGGIMDRFDSILFISPAIYYLSLFLLKKF